MSKKTHVQRTLEWLRDASPSVDIAFTERHIPHTTIKKDLYGIIDLVALVEVPYIWTGWELWGIQVCGGGDYAAHMKKILAYDKAYKWVHGINRVLILMGWRKLKQGWSPRIHRFSRGDWKSMPLPPTSKYSIPKVDRL